MWRPYVKPSLGGLLVIRKRNTIQTSARVAASKARVAEGKPAKIAYERCKAEGKTVRKRIYVPGQGYVDKEVCPINVFRKYLREAMKQIHGI